MDLTIDEWFSLEASQNVKEWNQACALIRMVRDGELPTDWFITVVASDLLNTIQKRWQKPGIFGSWHSNQSFADYIFAENLPAT